MVVPSRQSRRICWDSTALLPANNHPWLDRDTWFVPSACRWLILDRRSAFLLFFGCYLFFGFFSNFGATWEKLRLSGQLNRVSDCLPLETNRQYKYLWHKFSPYQPYHEMISFSGPHNLDTVIVYQFHHFRNGTETFLESCYSNRCVFVNQTYVGHLFWMNIMALIKSFGGHWIENLLISSTDFSAPIQSAS